MDAVLRLTAASLLGAVAAGTAHAAQGTTAQPIRRSVDRQVEAVVRSHLLPCEAAWRQGVPCFPIVVEEKGPRLSVKEALRTYRPDGTPAPGVPTSAEIQRQMSGAPLSASGGASLDPGCAAKALVRLVKGRHDGFYLYRTWNGGVEQPLLTDHKLDPNAYALLPSFRYELLGEFKSECAAMAAWRSALRGAHANAEGEPQEQESDPKPPQ